MSDRGSAPPLAATGVAGLDDILGGGLPSNRLYLIDGEPGTGKTTLALQFLLDGAARRRAWPLRHALREPRGARARCATSHGWTLDGIDIFELPVEDAEAAREDVHASSIPPRSSCSSRDRPHVRAVEKSGSPALVVLDSLSEMRLLARDPLRFRRQILALKQFFAARDCTVLLLDDKTAPEGDLQLHSLAHGVVLLEHVALEYGAERRRLQVTKLRGRRFQGGYHDFRDLHRRSRGVSAHRTPRRAARGRRPSHAERLTRARRAPWWWTAERYEPARHRTGGDGEVRPLHAVRVRRGDAW